MQLMTGRSSTYLVNSEISRLNRPRNFQYIHYSGHVNLRAKLLFQASNPIYCVRRVAFYLRHTQATCLWGTWTHIRYVNWSLTKYYIDCRRDNAPRNHNCQFFCATVTAYLQNKKKNQLFIDSVELFYIAENIYILVLTLKILNLIVLCSVLRVIFDGCK